MKQIADAPDIRNALFSGYGITVQGDRPDEPIFITEDGEMTKEEVVDYMIDYIRTNTEDAAEAFGIQVVCHVS